MLAIAPISIVAPNILGLIWFIILIILAITRTVPFRTCIAVCNVGNPRLRRGVATAIRVATQKMNTTKINKHEYRTRRIPRALWHIALMILIAPTVCASRDGNNQLPFTASTAATAAAVVYMLCPKLIQRAAALVAKLKANPTIIAKAADLQKEVGACVGEYLVDGESGNCILEKLISNAGGDSPIFEIDISLPSKTASSSLASPATTMGSPITNRTEAEEDLYCSDDNNEGNIVNWLEYHSDDDFICPISE